MASSNDELIRKLNELSRLYAKTEASETIDLAIKLNADFRGPLTDMFKYFGDADINA